MKVSPVFLQERKLAKSTYQNNYNPASAYCSGNLNNSYPKNYYLLDFQGRVEKDLNSFIQRNEANLPYSVKAYVENLSGEQKTQITPLQAQRNAFEFLSICDTVEDVKAAYPNEPLFSDLKSIDELKSKRGILYEIRLLQEDLGDEKLLLNGDSDLTLYLLKKIFLEGKTISEINDDLDKDINPAFKNEDKKYILSSTLEALGIKLPSVPYLNSLRYTREGYSDSIGEKISQRWKDLSQEQKDAIISSHTSKPMSKEQKDKISKINKERWMKMSDAQKTQVINAMQQGSHRKQIAMIDAWNNAVDVRTALTEYLINNNFYSPQSIIYRTESYSPAMEIVMTRFWSENPQMADKIGSEIELSYQRYDLADADGKLRAFEDDVIKTSLEIKSQIKKALKASKDKITQISPADKYKSMFSYLPEKLLEKQCAILSEMTNADVNLWIKYCMGQKLSTKELRRAEEITEIVAPRKGYEMQCLIAASINMLEECLAPIVNPQTGEEFAPIFPTNLDFRFPDIARMYFNLKKQGYKKFELIDSKALSGDNREKVAKDFLTERFTKEIIGRNPDVRFNFDLMNYKYKFSKQPDFERLNELYNEIFSYALTENQAQKAADRLCSYGANEQIVQVLADSFYYNPQMYYSHISPNSSDGMKLRVSRALNDFIEKSCGAHSTIYKRSLINYEKRFVKFFGIKE